MRFQPLNEDELNAQRGLLSPGDAQFEVVSAEETKSKAGNEMIKLTVRVWDHNGKEGTVFDYLVSNVQWKIKEFLEAIGNIEAYHDGLVTGQECLGGFGNCVLFIQKSKDPKYSDQVKIKSYYKKIKTETNPTSFEDNIPPSTDPDIPF